MPDLDRLRAADGRPEEVDIVPAFSNATHQFSKTGFATAA
jgi:hypothetical protein